MTPEPIPIFRQDFYIFEYAQEAGYLHLSENARKKLKIPVVIAQLDPDTDQCFGNRFNRLLIDEFLGYDEIMISSIKGLVDDEKNKGFVKNLATGQKYRFVTSTVLSSTYFWSFLAMIVFTFGVTVLLRFSHHLIFTFILSFVRTLEMHEPLEIPVAPLLTIMLALVGDEISATGGGDGSDNLETSAVGYSPVPPVNLINRNRRYVTTDFVEMNNVENSTSNNEIRNQNEGPP
uniref:Uncharacterized protein n=1 Tax=Romanomermis culicivorax TaxID=13658 RepID=A0A915HP96_ROMCU